MRRGLLRRAFVMLLAVLVLTGALPSMTFAKDALIDEAQTKAQFEERMQQWHREAKDTWDSYVIDWPDERYVIDEKVDGIAGEGYCDDVVMAFLARDVSPQDAVEALSELGTVVLDEKAAAQITEYSISHQFLVLLGVAEGASVQQALDELWECEVVDYASPSHLARVNGYATRGETNEEGYITFADPEEREEMERRWRSEEISLSTLQKYLYETSIAVYPCKKQVIPKEWIPGEHYAADVLIVIPEGRATPEEFLAVLDGMRTIELSEKERAKITQDNIDHGQIIVPNVRRGYTVQDAIDELWECDLVAYVGTDGIGWATAAQETNILPADIAYSAATSTNDPDVQPWLTAIDAPNAWDIAQCNYGVSVAVLDTGFNVSHEDLYGVLDLDHAYNGLDGTDDVDPISYNDPYLAGHGSRVAGIIAAQANNGVGIAGVSHNARIVPVKVFDDEGFVHEYALVAAYNYLLSQVTEDNLNLRVINMSLGATGASWSALEQVIALAANMRVVSVCSAGNAGNLDVLYDPVSQEVVSGPPASCEDCITVAAVTNQGAHAEFSTFSSDVDIAAPGVNILSTNVGGSSSYLADNGTSFAAPMVSGVAALLYAHNPLYGVDDVKDILCTSARDLAGSFVAPDGSTTITYGAGWDKVTGYGMLDAAAALEEAFDRDGSTEWVRAYGTTRYDTAAAVSAATFDSADCVVVASGVNFPDALSAASLAGGVSAPILTAPSSGLLPASEVSEIERLGASRAIIVGGPLIVSDAIKSQLEGIVGSGNVRRVYGVDRIGTCIAVAQELGSSHSNTAIVANGFSFADALSIGYYAYASKSPIFLTNSDGTLSASVVSAINAGNYHKVVIVGGTLAVKDSVKTQLAASGRTFYRISGANRYETNANVARWATGAITNAVVQPFLTVGVSKMYLATGAKFEDSLGASAAAGYASSVLIMCEDSAAGRYATTVYVQPRHHLIEDGVIVGGTLAVPSRVARDFMACAA